MASRGLWPKMGRAKEAIDDLSPGPGVGLPVSLDFWSNWTQRGIGGVVAFSPWVSKTAGSPSELISTGTLICTAQLGLIRG